MPKLIPIKPKKLVKILQRLGFLNRDAEGSHVFFKHPDGRTTVIPIRNRDLSKGLLGIVSAAFKLFCSIAGAFSGPVAIYIVIGFPPYPSRTLGYIFGVAVTFSAFSQLVLVLF